MRSSSADVQEAIIRALRFGGLDKWELAGEIDEAPFRVEAELKALGRQALVRRARRPRENVWALTTIGYEFAFAGDQLTLQI